MRLLGFILAAAFAVSPLAVRADDGAASLLSKHKSFVGWQAGDGTFSSLSFEGEITYQKDGKDVTYATLRELRKGFASRTIVQRSNGTGSDSGFTGRIFWDTNENGFTHPIIGDAQKAEIAADLLFNEGAQELAGTLRGSDTIDGTPVQIVRVKADASDNLDLYIDPQTGAYKRVVIDPDGSYEETIDILAYSDVHGKKIISKWQHKGSKYTYAWTKITADAPIADADLHPPGQTATWSFANGQSFPIEFKDNDRNRGIFLTASFNGVKGRFMMDTGAGGIFLNRSYAGRVHPKAIEKSKAYGIAGSTNTEVGKVDTFQIGKNTLTNVVVTSLSNDIFNGKDDEGNEVDGLIGYDLFGGAIVEVNLDDQQMTLFDPKQLQMQSGGGIELSVDLADETPTIPMMVNGNIPINAMLDSGDLAEVTISHDLVSKYGLKMLVDTSLQGITSAIRFTSGAGGIEREECGRLDSVSVGPVVYQNAPACKSRSFSGNNAIVGFDFIKNFNIIFDYPEGKMLLMPRAQRN
jgi:predicted aspartyl protease